ncbi:MAG: hypothetical protein DRQ10_04690 [Candidatus Hydrothermota bacterium]|nr:MAG: hypothetical protein DRQ10_04690 [Candidatus Hydrothermae bacterium]
MTDPDSSTVISCESIPPIKLCLYSPTYPGTYYVSIQYKNIDSAIIIDLDTFDLDKAKSRFKHVVELTKPFAEFLSELNTLSALVFADTITYISTMLCHSSFTSNTYSFAITIAFNRLPTLILYLDESGQVVITCAAFDYDAETRQAIEQLLSELEPNLQRLAPFLELFVRYY